MPHEFGKEHIELIMNLPVSAIVGADPANWSKPFWFRYFWQDATQRKSEFVARWQPIVDFFNAAFRLPYKWNPEMDEFDKDAYRKQGSGIYAYKGDDTQWRVKVLQTRGGLWTNTVSDGVLLACLTALLEAGFSKVTVVGGQVQDPSLTFVANAVRLQGTGSSYSCELGWRGDGRDFDDINRSGGFIARADSTANGFAQSCNLGEPWHPFSDPLVRSHYWFREGQSDNCLHTCISVALNFKTASTFPLLEHKMKGKKIPLTGPEAQTASTPTAPFFKVSVLAAGSGEIVYRYADRQQLYMVLLSGAGFDTKAKQQQKFPEIAMKFIPAANILACLVFVRVFHGTTDEEGFTLMYDATRSKPPTELKCQTVIADAELSKLLFKKVSRLFEETKAGMPYAAKWSASGAEDIPQMKLDTVPVKVSKVATIDGGAFWP